MGQGWRWDAYLETWIGVRWDLDGAEIQYPVTWMELRRILDGGETRMMGPVLDGGETRLDGRAMHILGLGWMWDLTWMGVRREFTDLDGGETGHWSRWDAYIETWIWVRWDIDGAELQFVWLTWMELRRDLDGGETWISGLRWRWDMIWMEVTHGYVDLDGSEI